MMKMCGLWEEEETMPHYAPFSRTCEEVQTGRSFSEAVCFDLSQGELYNAATSIAYEKHSEESRLSANRSALVDKRG